jgi:integrase
MVQIYRAGQRGTFTFGRNAEAAAEKARAIFRCIVEDGWPVAIERYSPRAATVVRRKSAETAARAHEEAVGGRIEKPTVGDLIRVASELSTVRPATLHGYAKSFRFIVSEMFAIPHTEEALERRPRHGKKPKLRVKDLRHDYRTGGLAKWREAVDSIALEIITPAGLQRWRKEYLTRAGADPVAIDRARVSFNKNLRQVKALFGRKILPFIESRMILPRPLFFEGARMESEPPMRYHSKIDPTTILRDATENLATSNPEAFKALFLCLVLGLRRNEADTLQWSQVDFGREEVAIVPTEHNPLKSRDSARVLALDAASLSILRGWCAGKPGPFVLKSPFQPRPLARTPVYRCKDTFLALAEWLRRKGITARKPIHELRKECGTLLLKQGQPIEAVSRYLGHSTLQVTMKHYADIAKRRATVDLSALMSADVVKFPNAAARRARGPAGLKVQRIAGESA